MTDRTSDAGQHQQCGQGLPARLGRDPRARRARSGDPAGRLPGPDGPLRVGQVDPAQPDRRPRPAQPGLGRGRRRADRPALRPPPGRLAGPPRGLVFQFYNLMPVLTAQKNVELPLLLTHLSRASARSAPPSALEIVGLAHRNGPLSPHALRRRAAAGGHRPGHRHRPDAAAVRRAHRRPRPQIGRRDPRPAPGPEPASRARPSSW